MEKQKHQSIVGYGRDRQEKDYYPTPSKTTEAIMIREKFEGEVWECACGDGRMSEVLKKYNKVFSTDIYNQGYGEKEVDFLKTLATFNTDNIITNPPFRYAVEFVKHAKKRAKKKIALLLKLVFLEGIGRYKMFQDKDFPLKKVYVFCRRQPIYKDGIVLKNSGLIAFAWFVWDKDYSGKPTIEWINDEVCKDKSQNTLKEAIASPPTAKAVGIRSDTVL